ncbi:MAG: oxygen-independent coproporphyrinogen III oxidase [Porticoccaceae bacterium]|nr:MAG: oxygen-independent coproporphyrinogen III oxidase [Porticoccaceae bacterium]
MGRRMRGRGELELADRREAERPTWDEARIARHDLTGPRYTSYPPATHFRPEVGAAEWARAAAASAARGGPLSLYVHIPFCSRVCYYCACNRIVTANRGVGAPYVSRLERELALVVAALGEGRTLTQLHWGGGTPTFLAAAELARLMTAIRGHFSLVSDDAGEFGIEVHPGDLVPEQVFFLRELGFNRLSMGVQDFDPEVQAAVNRHNDPEQVAALLAAARRAGFHSVSLDLIYGLPRQNRARFARTLEEVIALGPDRLSLFNYAHLPHRFKVQRQIRAAELPSPAEKLALFRDAWERLAAAGYRYIGMDHFALPGDELARAQEEGRLARNFQGYTVRRADELLGIGVSAIGELAGVYFQNHRDIARYNAAVDEGRLPLERGYVRSAEDLLRGRVIEELMCHFRLDGRALGERFGVDFWRHFAAERRALEALAAEGLATFEGEVLRATPLGRLLVRRLAMVFDAHLAGDGGRERYSRIL